MKKQSRIMSDLAVFSEPQFVCVWSLCKGSEGIEVKKVEQNTFREYSEAHVSKPQLVSMLISQAVWNRAGPHQTAQASSLCIGISLQNSHTM